jgi:hypothetical protein
MSSLSLASPAVPQTAAFRRPTPFEARVSAISTLTLAELERGGLAVLELARFEHTANYVVASPRPDGPTLIALVSSSVAEGPFHVVVDQLPPPFPKALPWTPTGAADIVLRVTERTRRFDPCPDWSQINLTETAIGEVWRLVAESARHRGSICSTGSSEGLQALRRWT